MNDRVLEIMMALEQTGTASQFRMVVVVRVGVGVGWFTWVLPTRKLDRAWEG